MGCVQLPAVSGALTCSTPSNVVFCAGKDESSDAFGRMNTGDSVNERASAAEGLGAEMVRVIKPPTYSASCQSNEKKIR